MSKLCEIMAGRSSRVLQIDSGEAARKRLSELGILPGEKIIMVHNQGRGPVTVEVKGSRLSLGHGISDKIIVREI